VALMLHHVFGFELLVEFQNLAHMTLYRSPHEKEHIEGYPESYKDWKEDVDLSTTAFIYCSADLDKGNAEEEYNQSYFLSKFYAFVVQRAGAKSVERKEIILKVVHRLFDLGLVGLYCGWIIKKD